MPTSVTPAVTVTPARIGDITFAGPSPGSRFSMLQLDFFYGGSPGLFGYLSVSVDSPVVIPVTDSETTVGMFSPLDRPLVPV